MSTKLIAKKIREARLESNLSQKELSSALLVSEKAVSSYESGRTQPSLETLDKIAKKTQKPIWYFTQENTEDFTLLAKLATIEAQLKEIKQILIKNRPTK